MLAAALLSLSLAVSVSYEPEDLAPNSYQRELAQMTPQQKFATLRPLVRSANDCVMHAIETNPRFRGSAMAADINELIVASMAPCKDAMRSMIDAHDRLFGEGSGEAFFMGPYLEGLPLTINKMVKGAAYEPKPTGE
jgi:hypothetical protein